MTTVTSIMSPQSTFLRLLDFEPVVHSLSTALFEICPPVTLYSLHNHTVEATTYDSVGGAFIARGGRRGIPSPAWCLAQTCRKAYRCLAKDLYRIFQISDHRVDLATARGLLPFARSCVQ